MQITVNTNAAAQQLLVQLAQTGLQALAEKVGLAAQDVQTAIDAAQAQAAAEAEQAKPEPAATAA
jgi:protein-disulfide isomerase-like protein with CxxC motif